MMQNWTKNTTTKNEDYEKFKKYKKDKINGYVYVKHILIFF